MRQTLQLHIAEPCHENWQQMTPLQQGRFCGSCQKIVVDFSRMTDSQLLDYFKNYQGDSCGRFEDSQLERPLLPPPPTKPSWHKWVMAALFSGFLFSSKARAQGLVAIKKELRQQPLQVKGEEAVDAQQPQKKNVVIRGSVVDEHGTGIPYASVQVKGEKWGVVADSLGEFILRIDTQKDLTLLYSSTGYEEIEQAFCIADAPIKQTIMLTAKNSLQDAVVIGDENFRKGKLGGLVSVITYSTSFQADDKKSGSGISVYPNPAKPGATVFLSFKKAGTYSWRLAGTNGAIISSQAQLITYAGGKHSFILSSGIAAGQYFVQILGSDGKPVATEKLAVVR